MEDYWGAKEEGGEATTATDAPAAAAAVDGGDIDMIE